MQLKIVRTPPPRPAMIHAREVMAINPKLIVLGLGMVLVAGTLGFDWVDALFPSAEAHGVQAQLQSRFVRIEDETFNTQSMQTGEILTVQGRLVSLVERDLRAWVSIFSESEDAGDWWEVVDRDPPGGVFDFAGDYPPYMAPLDNWDPPGGVFDIAGNSVVPYTVSARALHEGVYHMHTQLNVATVGPGLGPGATVVVEGEPIARPAPPGGISEDLLLIIVAGVILGGIAAAFVIKARSGGGGVPRQHLHAYTHDTHTIWDTLRTIGGVMVRPTRTFERIRDFDHYYLPRAACVTATVIILGIVANAESLSGRVGTTTLGVPPSAYMGLGVLIYVCFLTSAYYVGKRMGGNANWRKVFAVLMYTDAVLLAPAMLGVFDVYVGIPHYGFGAGAAVGAVVGATFGVWYIIIFVFAMRSVNMFGTWRALKAIILASLPIMALIIAVSVLVVMWTLPRWSIWKVL